MSVITDIVSQCDWSGALFPEIWASDRKSALPDERAEVILFGPSAKRSRPSDPAGTARFIFNDDTTGYDIEAIPRQAKLYSHPYTQALLLDFYCQLSPTKERRNRAAVALATYVLAIQHFSARGTKDPADFWSACCDAIWGGRHLADSYGFNTNDLFRAATQYLSVACNHGDLRVAEHVVLALTGGHNGKIRTKNVDATILSDLWATAGNLVAQATSECGQLLHEFKALADTQGTTDRQKKAYEALAKAGLSAAVFVNPVAAIGRLKQAADTLRSVGGPLYVDVLREMEAIMPEVLGGMDTIQTASAKIDLTKFKGLVAALAAMDARTAIRSLAYSYRIRFIPDWATVKRAADNSRGASSIRQIVSVLPVAQQGPAGVAVDTELLHMMDTCMGFLDTEWRYGLVEDPSLTAVFSPDNISEALTSTGIVGSDQVEVLREGLAGWANKKWTAASAILLPLTEHAFSTYPPTVLGGASIVMAHSGSMQQKVGGSVAGPLRDVLGENWAQVYEHIWDRENAPRHAYCHGFIKDEDVNSVAVDYAVMGLLALLADHLEREEAKLAPPAPTSPPVSGAGP